jgi:hypothetical protein
MLIRGASTNELHVQRRIEPTLLTDDNDYVNFLRYSGIESRHGLPSHSAIVVSMEPFLEEKACNACGGRGHRVVYFYPAGYYPHDRFETASWDGRQHVDMRIVECTGCGLRFTHPSFREEYLHLVYPDDIIHSPDVIRAGFSLGARKPNAILKVAARHAKRGATLLDIGTRYGALPFVAHHKYGFDAHGLELNRASVEQGKAHFGAISQGSIRDVAQLMAKLGWSSIDVAIMDDVIEHLVDPKRDLQTLAASQKSGNLLLLHTMDCGGWGARLFRKDWYYVAPAAHMYYFDANSLGRLLRAAGYEPIEVRRASLPSNAYRSLRGWLHRELKPRLLRRQRRAAAANPRPSQVSQRSRLDDDLFTMVARRI